MCTDMFKSVYAHVQGYGIPEQRLGITVPFILDGQECALRHGSVVFAALASCTNLSNPSVMLMAGKLLFADFSQ